MIGMFEEMKFKLLCSGYKIIDKEKLGSILRGAVEE